MPTDYPGDPVATEAPSVPPTPGVVPIVQIPNDGEARNAASITQALKVLADFQAWQMSPRAQAGAGGIDVKYEEAVQIWRSAKLHKRFGIDHLGYPMGQIQRWEQDWEVGLSQSGTGSSATTDDGWAFVVLKAGGGTGSVVTHIPSTTWPESRYARVDTGDGAGDKSLITKLPPCFFHADVALAMEWTAKIPSLQNYSIGMGFNTEISFSAGGHGPIAQFYNVGGSGNWRCHTDDGTTLNDQDSGEAVGTAKTRFRIEYHGANVDDAATERVLFFINGALVGNLTANMPSVPASPFASPIFIQYNTGGSGGALEVSPIRGANNLFVDAF
jgi:hypothetical protein